MSTLASKWLGVSQKSSGLYVLGRGRAPCVANRATWRWDWDVADRKTKSDSQYTMKRLSCTSSINITASCSSETISQKMRPKTSQNHIPIRYDSYFLTCSLFPKGSFPSGCGAWSGTHKRISVQRCAARPFRYLRKRCHCRALVPWHMVASQDIQCVTINPYSVSQNETHIITNSQMPKPKSIQSNDINKS